ncbi:MAG: RagB/SusD family nutrient uptake outer membrane protein [Bacteroidales bacterium]
MKRKVIYIFLLATVILQSCNSFLDIQPKGYTIPSKYEDYRQLMNYAQMYKASDSYPNFITDDVLMGGEGSTECNYIDLATEEKNLYTFEHGDIFADGDEDGLWNYSYQRIYTCNTVINNVLTAEGGTVKERKVLCAEARVARAFEYLIMIGCYSPAYNKATAATDYGLPIITKTDVSDITWERSSVEEVYKFIKTDLDEAVPDLLDAVPYSFRSCKSVAYGFLARMYIMREEYDKALENAVAAIKVNKSLVDLNGYTINHNKGIGRIVKITNPEMSFPDGKNNPENIFPRYAPYVFGLSTSVFASQDLLDTYKKDLPAGAIDKRKELWFVENEFPSWGMSFPGYTMYMPYTYSNLGLSTMEIILTAAECYARRATGNDLNESANLYNYLRDNRIENNVHVSFANAEEALRKVLDERRRELPFLGATRLIDLKRLNKDPRFAKTITHTDGLNGTQKWTLEPNDPRYVFPLPPVVKSFNPNIPDYTR